MRRSDVVGSLLRPAYLKETCGEEVDPAKYYFRAMPVFETGAAKYDWLNRIVAVCSSVRAKSAVCWTFTR